MFNRVLFKTYVIKVLNHDLFNGNIYSQHDMPFKNQTSLTDICSVQYLICIQSVVHRISPLQDTASPSQTSLKIT